ncbi:hypothetical protein VZ95_05410 [Elstera litoralis]|uniref:Uncharacterized protein n=1 Tax=Elstera litoralis TaxID=552518 RepID=A0A0F3IUI1_9PROT|nr:hypothetical protein [Elstera litoralis]KJV10366.1 hypothetical protein VZ95_05410 [Elstera litoralis]
MKSSFVDTLVGFFVGFLGLIGLFLASGAVDAQAYLFGLSLFVMAILYNFFLIKGHFDRADAARHG